jgi:saccharopine dehydrogenase-like NADP-dependent oxidoreductase
MKNGKVTEAKEPLKTVEERDDISVSMKLEVYPNRDSVLFMKKFGMEDCETFIRGTIRFKGFSFIISNFHDKGFTSDDPVPSSVKTLRDLVESKLPKQVGHIHPKAEEAIKNSLDMLSKED